jgi:hypothetical protein
MRTRPVTVTTAASSTTAIAIVKPSMFTGHLTFVQLQTISTLPSVYILINDFPQRLQPALAGHGFIAHASVVFLGTVGRPTMKSCT